MTRRDIWALTALAALIGAGWAAITDHAVVAALLGFWGGSYAGALAMAGPERAP